MSTTTLATGKFLQLVNKNGWEYAERVIGSGVVVIIPVFQNKLVLVEQYRPSVAKNVIELPAGLVGDVAGEEKESFEVAARRELLEETGYYASRLSFLFEGPATSGVTNEIVSFYFASDLEKKGEGGGDATENIKVHVIPIDDVVQWTQGKVKEGYLLDPKIFAGLYFCIRHREGKL